MDHTIVKKVDDYAPTGQGIVSATKTPYEIILEYEWASADQTIPKEDLLQSVTLDADGKRLTNKVGMIPIKGHNVSKITEYYFPARTEEEYIAIQERIYNGDQNTLEEYVKSISTYQIEINFDE